MERRRYVKTSFAVALTGTIGGCSSVLSDTDRKRGSPIGQLRLLNIHDEPITLTTELIKHSDEVIYKKSKTVSGIEGDRYVSQEIENYPSDPVTSVKARVDNQVESESIPGGKNRQMVDVIYYPEGKLGISRWGSCESGFCSPTENKMR